MNDKTVETKKAGNIPADKVERTEESKELRESIKSIVLQTLQILKEKGERRKAKRKKIAWMATILGAMTCLVLLVSSFRAHANYSPRNYARVHLNNNMTSLYIIYDVPQYYMSGSDGKKWYLSCRFTNLQQGTLKPMKVKVTTSNYIPVSGADRARDYIIKFADVEKINGDELKFYMGKLSCPAKESQIGFIIYKNPGPETVETEMCCTPYEEGPGNQNRR